MKDTFQLFRLWGALILAILSGTSAQAGDIGSMTWTPRQDWVNVKDCVGKYQNFSGTVNAVGDGKADDTAAIQAVLTYVGPRLGQGSPYGHFQTIYFPPGTYKISDTLKLNFGKRVAIIGSGRNTVLIWTGAKGGAMFTPTDANDMVYRGLVWDGNNLAGCGVLQCSIADSNYDGNIRHENESFRNFVQAGTYAPLGQYGNPAPGAVPGAGIAGGFNGVRGDSLEADSMIVNCRFSNCTDGFFNAWAWGNQTEWTIDGCEFDGCSGTAVDFHGGASDTVVDTHFEGNGTDVGASANVHLRRCTSRNSGQFYNEWQGSYSQDVISDCWIDHWKNKDSAIALQDEGGHMVFDCTFTHAPEGAAGAIANHEIWQGTIDQLLLSNNFAPDFPLGLGLINPGSNNISPLVVPPGVRCANIKSPAQTFLDTSDFTDGGNIIDVTAAPYNVDRSGNVDVTAGLQAAIDAAKAANNGSIVYLPCGSYLIKAPLNLTGGNYTLEGSINTAIWYWEATGSALNVTLSGAGKIAIHSLFMGHGSPTSIINVTAKGPQNYLELKEIISNLAGAGNPWVGAPDLDSKGIVFSSLPAGTNVFLDHISASITSQNSSAAEITGRFLQNGEINVSGDSPKTGCIGFVSNEGEAVPGSPEYAVNVRDNQNLTIEGWYDENNGASVNDYYLAGDGKTSPGKVVIQGFNHFSAGAAQDLKIENFSGLFFLGPQSTACGGGPLLTQTGDNPVTIMLSSIDFGAPPVMKFGPQATGLVLNNHLQRGGDFGGYVPNSPTIPTGENMLSFSTVLDQLRQLGEVELRTRFHVKTENSPIASYAFEGNARDLTGTYDGINHGGIFAAGEVGYCGLQLNGKDQFIEIPHPTGFPVGKGARTITGWARAASFEPGLGTIAAYGAPGKGAAMFIGRDGSALVGGAPGSALTVANFWDDNWHFVALTFDGTNATLFADGKQVGAAGESWDLLAGPAYVGKQVDNSGFWNGNIDQVQVYDQALGADAVASLYQHQRLFTPLAGHWRLNETSGTACNDASGNGVMGTISGSSGCSADHPPQINSTKAGSRSFNGKDDYVALAPVNALPIGNASRTMSAWVKADNTTGNHFICAYGAPSTDNAFLIGLEGTTLYGSGYGNDMTVPNAISDNNWHLVSLTYDGTTESLYLDGALKTSKAETLFTKPQSGFIGQMLGNMWRWQGKIADVRIYNRCLSADEVRRLDEGSDL